MTPVAEELGGDAPEPEDPARESAGPERRVLVVDGDGVSRRYLEGALSTAPAHTESARTLGAASELLRTHRFDLVVTETLLPDGDGYALCRLLKQDQRHAGAPVIFFTADDRVPTRVRAFDNGAVDFIVKPCAPQELALRCNHAIERARRANQPVVKNTALRGDLSVIPFSDLVVMLEMSRQSGELLVRSEGGTGRLYFDQGHLVGAERSGLRGPQAFYKMSWHYKAEFEFLPGSCTLPVESRDIQETVTSLLIEGARQFDEAKTARFPALPGGRTSRPPPPPNAVRIRNLLRPTPQVVGPLLAWLDDPFSLGSLRFWSSDAVANGEVPEADRILGLLLAEPSSAVGPLLELASPPDERWVIDALNPASKLLGLDIWVAHGVGIDLLVVDPSAAGDLVFKEVPAFAILAPTNGDYDALSVVAKVAVESAICEVEPLALVAVGRDMEGALHALGPVRRGTTKLELVDGALGTHPDLRALVRRGVCLWRDHHTP